MFLSIGESLSQTLLTSYYPPSFQIHFGKTKLTFGGRFCLKILWTLLATSYGTGVCWGCTGLRLLHCYSWYWRRYPLGWLDYLGISSGGRSLDGCSSTGVGGRRCGCGGDFCRCSLECDMSWRQRWWCQRSARGAWLVVRCIHLIANGVSCLFPWLRLEVG